MFSNKHGPFNNRSTLDFVARTIELLREQGKKDEAEKIVKKSVSILEKLPHCLWKKYFLRAIIGIYETLGSFKEALEYSRNLLDTSVKSDDPFAEKSAHLHLANCYNRLGKYEFAISCAEKAISLSEKTKDKSGKISDGGARGFMAQAHRALGNYREAIELLKEVLDRSREDGNELEEGYTSVLLGTVCREISQYQKAQEFLENGIDIGEQLNDPSLKCAGYQELSTVYSYFGKPEKAFELCEKCRLISLETGDESQLGGYYYFSAAVYRDCGNYERAEDYYQLALTYALKFENRLSEGSCYLGLGTVYPHFGKHDQALQYLEKCEKLYLEIGQPLHTCYSQIGYVYYLKREYVEGEKFYKKSLEIAKQMGDRVEMADVYNHLGQLLLVSGEYDRAVRQTELAYSLNLELGDSRKATVFVNNLAWLYCYLEQFDKAIECCSEALAMYIKVGNRLGEGEVYDCLANIYVSKCDYEKAIENCARSLDIYESTGCLSGVVTSCCNMGASYLLLYQPEEAVKYFEKSVAVGGKVELVNGWLGIGYVHARKFEKAVVPLKKAIESSNKLVHGLIVDERITWQSRQFYPLYSSLAMCYFFFGRLLAASLVRDLGKAKALQISLERLRNREDVEELEDAYGQETWREIEKEAEKKRLTQIARDLRLRENNATVLFYSLELAILPNSFRIWVLNPDGESHLRIHQLDCDGRTPEDWFTEATNKLLSGLFAGLANRHCSFYGSLLSHPVLDVFQEESFLGTAPCGVGNPSNSGVKEGKGCQQLGRMNDDIRSAELTSLEISPTLGQCGTQASDFSPGTALTRIIRDGGSVTDGSSDSLDSTDSSSTLYHNLVKPVVDFVEGDKLIIVPDKVLFFTPFCMLKDAEGYYLSERYSIQVAPSLHTLALSMKVPRPDVLGPALFIGNPTVGEVVVYGEPFPATPLPSAEEEARVLATRFNAKPLLKDQATKSKVLERISSASIVHIAAHGHPKYGDILLAPSVSDQQGTTRVRQSSFLLTQRDVVIRQLSAQLVVLCCCHTASGEPTTEGVLGIARAFLGAGVRTVLVALWSLADDQTKVFMEHFYDNICEGSSSCVALKKAMNVFQKSPNERCRSFSTWAPFTIIGEDVRFTKEEIEQIRKFSGHIGD